MRQNRTHSRLFRAVYNAPKERDIPSSIDVGMLRVAADAFKRLALARTEGLALKTTLRGIAGVNQHKWDSRELGFIFQKGSQLKERPTAYASAKDAAFLYAAQPYPFQVFQSNPPAFVLSLLDDSLCDRMVHDARSRSLFSRKPFQGLFTTRGAFGLKRRSYALAMQTIFFNFLSRHLLSGGERGDISQTKINTKKLFHVFNCFIRHIDGLKQKKLTLASHEVSLTVDVWKQPFVVAKKLEALDASVDRPDADGSALDIVRQNPRVISNRTERPESSQGFFVELVGIGDLRYRSDDGLSGKIRGLFDAVVAKVMQLHLIKSLLIPSRLRDVVANLVDRAKGTLKNLRLKIVRQELYLKRQLHTDLIFQISEKVKKGGGATPPPAEPDGLLASNL